MGFEYLGGSIGMGSEMLISCLSRGFDESDRILYFRRPGDSRFITAIDRFRRFRIIFDSLVKILTIQNDYEV